MLIRKTFSQYVMAKYSTKIRLIIGWHFRVGQFRRHFKLKKSQIFWRPVATFARHVGAN